MKQTNLSFFIAAFTATASAQPTANLLPLYERNNVVTTAVPFLLLPPEARGAAIGDAGAATPDDHNAIYWNMAKSVFNREKYAVSYSYTPWIGSVLPDISLRMFTGYYKPDENSAISASFRSLSLGTIESTNNSGVV